MPLLLRTSSPPPETGAAASLTREAVGKMKYAELKIMCSELQLGVSGRAKAPFQAALYAWIDEHGAAAAVAQPQQAALKVCCRTLGGMQAHMLPHLQCKWNCYAAVVLAVLCRYWVIAPRCTGHTDALRCIQLPAENATAPKFK
jgi:hypothetical protein